MKWLIYFGALFVSILPAQHLNMFNALEKQISEDSLIYHMTILGSDSLRGRGTGTLGGDLAAHYISNRLASYGLIPAGDDGSYYQKIPMHGSLPLPASQFSIFYQDSFFEKVQNLKLGEDYLLYHGGAQTYIPNPVSLVFAGYGIIAPEFDYNDYQTIDVERKIVVFLEGEPYSEDSSYFAGELPTIYSLPESKQRLAISRGAVGSILIPVLPPKYKEKKWNKLKKEFSFEDIGLAYRVTGQLSTVINPDLAESLFVSAPYSFQKVLEMDRNNTIKSFPLHIQASFRGKFVERDFTASNVTGILPGIDPDLKKNYLIISSHYDHLGIGPALNSDSIYNGVLDNAVGVSANLEIARVLSLTDNRPRRSILFLFSTGEEKGLLGSTYYTDHPIVPLHKTVANINIDGLATFKKFQDIYGIGSELSTLGNFLNEASKLLNVEYADVPPLFKKSEAFARSDQIAFAKAGIPSMLIMEGLKLENTKGETALFNFINWMENIYHSPFDDLNQKINVKAMKQHTHIILTTTLLIANSEHEPQWHPGVPYNIYRLQTASENR